jgi:ketosteroid isomerase-like protein
MQNFSMNEENETQMNGTPAVEFKKDQLGDPEFEVHHFMKNYAGAVRGGNLEEILSYYSDDIEAFACPKIHYATEFSFPVGYQFIAEKIFADGKLATFSALVCISGKSKRTFQPLESWYRLTCVLEKSQGYWQIAHDHLSVPFATDDGDFDLVSQMPTEHQTH